MEDGTVNGLNGSRWGVRTAEPITSDLTVGAWLESGFGVDTGGSFQGGRLFGRQAFAYVNSKTWGDLRLGRQYVFADNILPPGNPFNNALLFNPTTSVTNNGRSVATMLDAPRADNVVQYKTPDLNGFWAGAQWAPHENATGPVDSFYGFAAAYAKQQTFFGVSYEYNDQRSTGSKVNKSLSFGGRFDFGLFRLMGNYQTVDDLAISNNGHAGGQLTNLIIGQGTRTITARDQSGYLIGAEIPFRAATFGIGYTRMEYEGTPSAAGLPDSYTLGKIVFGVKYDLSRRTFLYSTVSMADGDLSRLHQPGQAVPGGHAAPLLAANRVRGRPPRTRASGRTRNEQLRLLRQRQGNPIAMDGIEFIEYATSQPQAFGGLLQKMGFSAVARHRSREVMLYRQGAMNVIVNSHPVALPGLAAPWKRRCSRPWRCACATRRKPTGTRSTAAPGRCRRAPLPWSSISPASTAWATA